MFVHIQKMSVLYSLLNLAHNMLTAAIMLEDVTELSAFKCSKSHFSTLLTVMR
jgi:hypothetical protein